MAKFTPIVLMGNSEEEVSILREYAEFWKVPFTLTTPETDQSIAVSSNTGIVDQNVPNPIILSPVGVDGAREIAKRFGLEFKEKESWIRIKVTSSASVSLRATLHQYSGPSLEESLNDEEHSTILYRVHRSNVYILSIDLISEYQRLLHNRMDEDVNWKFQLVARMPLSYGLIPSSIRNRAFRTNQDLVSVEGEAYGPIECLRSIFLASLVTASPRPIPIIRFWRRGKSYALAISHDVETQPGLEDGAARLMEVEKQLGIRSTWNLPSDRYPLSSQLLVSLSKSGELGAHDTKHDGKLILTRDKAKTERVRRCKDKLERLSGKEVRGFRAPLLQHSRSLVDSLAEAGYEYDSSMPSWEPLSPTSLKPHGVGTVFPFQISGIVEIPVSMPQDHQLLRVGGLGVTDAVDYLVKISNWIKNVGGACVLLVHPDYEFSEDKGLREYSRLLESLRSDPSCDIMTMNDIARWWMRRQRSFIDDSGKIETDLGDAGKESYEDPEVAFVTRYGPDGFTTQSPSSVKLVEAKEISER